MVIAPKDFRDEELKVPRKMLAERGVAVTVASTTLNEITGMLGMRTKADMLLKDAKATDYDAVVFIGGNGAKALFDNKDAIRLARKADGEGKIVAAICIAPCILAYAGVLEKHKATVFPTGEFIGILRENGATVLRKPLVEDHLTITANGPKASARFGDALVRALAMPFKNDPPP